MNLWFNLSVNIHSDFFLLIFISKGSALDYFSLGLLVLDLETPRLILWVLEYSFWHDVFLPRNQTRHAQLESKLFLSAIADQIVHVTDVELKKVVHREVPSLNTGCQKLLKWCIVPCCHKVLLDL